MSLDIKKITDDSTKFILEGKLDTVTAPQLESALNEVLDDAKELVFDFENLEYISSAGLRVILKAQKAKEGKGGLKIKNANSNIKEIFDITGFSDFLNIE